jgi:hypothetical protein
VTTTEAVRIPPVETLLNGLRAKRFLTTLDLASAYWQTPVVAESIPKTAFICGQGVFQWKRTPYGLKNAPGYFTRVLENILLPVAQCNDRIFVASYIDDVVIATTTFADHISIIRRVFDLLRSVGLKVSLPKCAFGQRETLYLGWICSATGIKPNPERVLAITEARRPTTIKELRRFIGMSSYYSACVRDFSTIAAPMFRLLMKNAAFEWTDECQTAWQTIKDSLAMDILVHHPDPTRPFFLYTDASDLGIGGSLEQFDEAGVTHSCGCFSKKFSSAETRYSTSEKEAMALIYGLRFFTRYLIGSKVTVLTDHAALRALVAPLRESHRLSRWRSELAEYDVNIVYKRGKELKNADYFSRNPICPPDMRVKNGQFYADADEERTKFVPSLGAINAPVVLIDPIAAITSITHKQSQCEQCTLLRQLVEHNVPPDEAPVHLTALAERCSIVDDTIVIADAIGGGRLVPIVPVALRTLLMQQAHNSDTSGHMRMPKLYNLLAARCFWPHMQKEIVDFLTTCETCVMTNPGHALRPHLKPFITSHKLERLVIDVLDVGPSESGFRKVLVAVDHFTRFPFAVPIVDESAESLIDALVNHIIQYFGVPAEIVGDAHRSHTSDTFTQFCNGLGIVTNFSRGYTHRHAGQAERMNRSVLSMLRRCSATKLDWSTALPYVLLELRASVCAATGFSPFFMMFGHEAVLPVDKLLQVAKQSSLVDYPTHIEQVAQCVALAHDQARQQLMHTRAIMVQEYCKRNRTCDIKLSTGELIYIHSEGDLRAVENRKLTPHQYVGPYRVLEVHPPLVIASELDNDTRETFHLSDVVRARGRASAPYYGRRRRRTTKLSEDTPEDTPVHHQHRYVMRSNHLGRVHGIQPGFDVRTVADMTRRSESWRPSLLAREMPPLPRAEDVASPAWAHSPVGLFTEGYVVRAVSERLERDRERDRLAAWRRRMLNAAAFDFGTPHPRGHMTTSTSLAPSTSSTTPSSSTRENRKRAHTRRGGVKKRRVFTMATTTAKDSKKVSETKQTSHIDNDLRSPMQRHLTPIPRPSSTSTDSADTALGASRTSLSFVHERPIKNQVIDEFTESELLD